MDAVAGSLGRVEILVNSAGITGETNKRSHETRTEDLRLVFDVNFMGSYFTSKYVLPLMVRQGYGRILHIASIAGKEGNAGMIAYSASKAAVIALTLNVCAPAVEVSTRPPLEASPEQSDSAGAPAAGLHV